MNQRRKLIATALLVGPLLLAPHQATAQDSLALASRAANEWLALTDSGDAKGSWHTAAGIFRRALTVDAWKTALDQARTPAGAVVSRALVSTNAVKDLPGAPSGDYVVMQFETTFATAPGPVIETVTPMLDEDGQWRVVGYFIRPKR